MSFEFLINYIESKKYKIGNHKTEPMVVLLISRFIFIPEQRNMLKPIPNIRSADPKFGCLKIRKKIVAKKNKSFSDTTPVIF